MPTFGFYSSQQAKSGYSIYNKPNGARVIVSEVVHFETEAQALQEFESYRQVFSPSSFQGEVTYPISSHPGIRPVKMCKRINP